jgi:hypothetical protein
LVCYFDASALLAAILEQPAPEFLRPVWDASSVRLSSMLLKMESRVSLRRAGALLGLAPDSGWVRSRSDLLDDCLAGIVFKPVDDDIDAVVKGYPVLADCRSLDAIHVATALFFRPYHDEPITIVSMDRRMRDLAKRLDFPLLPKR